MSWLSDNWRYQQVMGKLAHLEGEVKKMAAGLDALNKAVADLGAAIQTETTTITNTTAQIAEAVKELAQSEDPAAQAAADTLETLVGQINTSTQNLATAAAALPAAPVATDPGTGGSAPAGAVVGKVGQK